MTSSNLVNVDGFIRKFIRSQRATHHRQSKIEFCIGLTWQTIPKNTPMTLVLTPLQQREKPLDKTFVN